jgi:dihydrofolate synthase / folylpolyglutamate synthase
MPSTGFTDPAPRFTQLADWLAWQETQHPKLIDMGLARIRQVAARLDATLGGHLLRPKAKTILVAGTNGKGSCVASMAALFRTQGLSVGCYTSPHLLRYNERIQINGLEASDDALCAAFTAIDQVCGEISLSYFEFGTLAAFWLMAQANVDVWLIEVGLGGRLDATNIIDADIAIITSIALDHEAYLGDTRELIALEKLGIARKNSLLICAEPNPPTSLLEGAEQLGCPVLWAGKDFSWCAEWSAEAPKITLTLSQNRSVHIAAAQLPLPSIAAAWVACDVICNALGQTPDSTEWAQVLTRTRLAGRWQRFTCQGVDVLIDVAHNPASTQALAEHIGHQAKPFVLLMGMMADKNIAESLKPLRQAQHLFAVNLPIERAASAAQLAEQARAQGISASEHEQVAAALEQALAQCRETGARLVVCGSFYTLAAAYPALTALAACEVCNG